MVRTLNELTTNLKDLICDMQSDAHNASGFDRHRYHNLKIEIPPPGTVKFPQFKIRIGISEVVFNMDTLEKIKGSLGRDEKYVIRWLKSSAVLSDLRTLWELAEKYHERMESDN